MAEFYAPAEAESTHFSLIFNVLKFDFFLYKTKKIDG